jgi:plasmid stabilization system protein ParE
VRVRLSEPAEHELEIIGDVLARTDPQRAVAAVIQLRKSVRSIARAPKLCPTVPWSSVPRLRKKKSGAFLLLFQLNEEEALVLHIMHERSDWASLV